MQKKPKTYKKLITIFLLLVTSSTVLFYLIQWNSRDDNSVEILSPQEKVVVSLFKDKTIPIEGLHGTVIVEIKNYQVHIIQSDCPDKTCIKTGFIASPGTWILCAPNRVLVRIVRKKPGGNQSTLVTY